MEWLNDAILDYIKNNPNEKLNSLNIISYFKLRVDVIYTAIQELENDGKIIRHNGPFGGWNGNHYYEVR